MTPFHRATTIVTGITALALSSSLSLAAPPCGDWELVPTPNLGNSVTRLTGVTVLSPTDAWSVGYWRSEPSGRGPVVLHWDGTAWGTQELPGTSDLGTLPETHGVAATPSGEVWFVGNVTTTYPTYNLPLVLRWSEGEWSYVDTVTLRAQGEYPYADRGGFLYEAAALASDDVWAVGIAAGFGDGAATSIPLAVHWDGSTWTEVNVPRVANRHHELDDVCMIASDDVWAVGDYRNIAGAFRAVSYHWDGSTWSYVPNPIEAFEGSGLDDVVASGPNDVWAIGNASSGPLLMHWDGSEWSLMPPPPNHGGSMAAVGENDLWVSGWNGFWHWDGIAWTEVPSSVPGSTYVIRSGGMAIVDDCDIWSVGFWTLADGITSFSLAERLGSAGIVSVPAQTEARTGLVFGNPYRAGTPIREAGVSSGTAELVILDLHGRAVRTLGRSEEGRAWTWDGRDEVGSMLPPGMYFLRLETGTSTSTQKLLRLE